jgi:hypothetical protein
MRLRSVTPCRQYAAPILRRAACRAAAITLTLRALRQRRRHFDAPYATPDAAVTRWRAKECRADERWREQRSICLPICYAHSALRREQATTAVCTSAQPR